jgi:hypothetical protein
MHAPARAVTVRALLAGSHDRTDDPPADALKRLRSGPALASWPSHNRTLSGRPKLAGVLPVLWSLGAGQEVDERCSEVVEFQRCPERLLVGRRRQFRVAETMEQPRLVQPGDDANGGGPFVGRKSALRLTTATL